MAALAAVAWARGETDPPSVAAATPLRIDEDVRGKIDANSPRGTVVLADGTVDTRARTDRYAVRVEESDRYHFILRSTDFDAFLSLRDADGDVLATDDDGLGQGNALIDRRLEAGTTYELQAGSRGGLVGVYYLRMRRGPAKIEKDEAGAESVYETTSQVGPALLRLVAQQQIAGGRYAEAGRVVDQLLEAVDALFASPNAASQQILADCGSMLETLGRYDDARPVLERSIRQAESIFGRLDPRTWIALRRLADLLASQGNLADSIDIHSELIELVTGADDADAAFVGECQLRFAWTLLRSDRAAEAAAQLRRAIARFDEAYGSNSIPSLEATLVLAIAHLDAGDVETARPLLANVSESWIASYGPDHPVRISPLLASARLEALSGRPQAAVDRSAEAVRVATVALGEDHPHAMDTRSSHARRLAAVGRVEEALAQEQHALDARERVLTRQLAVLSEAERFLWAAEHRDSLDRYLELGIRTGLDATAPERLYAEVLRWKGRISRGLRRDRERVRLGKDAEESRADALRLRRVLAELGAFRETTPGANGATQEPSKRGDAPSAASERITELRKERERIEARLFRRNRAEVARDTIDPGLLRGRALRAGEVFVDFLVRDPEAIVTEVSDAAPRPAELIAFVVQRDRPIRCVRLGPMPTIESEIRDYVGRIASDRGGPLPGVTNAVAAAAAPVRGVASVADGGSDGARLRDLLFAPLGLDPNEVDVVIVSPDEAVATLPFAVLPGEDEGKFLLESYRFVYAQSAARLLDRGPATDALPEPPRGERSRDERPQDERPQDERPGRGALLVGGIDYGAAARGGRSFAPLPGTLREVRALADLFPESRDRLPGRATILAGQGATEAALKAGVPGVRFLHLATHGFFAGALEDRTLRQVVRGLRSASRSISSAVPAELLSEARLAGLRSGVALAGANAGGDGTEDGILTAEEAGWLDLHACELVTLSACESGVGSPRAGESLIGLRRSLALAGARATLTSLWKVDDAATAELMTDFYSRLWLEGQGKGVALHEAQVAQLRRNRDRMGRPAPGTWGAFILEGDRR